MAEKGAPFGKAVSFHLLQAVPHPLFQRTDAEILGCPFPDIADHVVQAKIVRGERFCRCRGGIAVSPAVGLRKPALPDVAGHEICIIRFVITPGKAHIPAPAARGMFPLCLARQTAANPGRIGGGIMP